MLKGFLCPPTLSVEILLFQAKVETWGLSPAGLCVEWGNWDGKSCSHIPHTPMAFLHPGPHRVRAEQRGSWRASCICSMVGSSLGYLMWLHFQYPPTPLDILMGLSPWSPGCRSGTKSVISQRASPHSWPQPTSLSPAWSWWFLPNFSPHSPYLWRFFSMAFRLHSENICGRNLSS